jgi:hypothetical protein
MILPHPTHSATSIQQPALSIQNPVVDDPRSRKHRRLAYRHELKALGKEIEAIDS